MGGGEKMKRKAGNCCECKKAVFNKYRSMGGFSIGMSTGYYTLNKDSSKVVCSVIP